jgi:glucosamine kinase
VTKKKFPGKLDDNFIQSRNRKMQDLFIGVDGGGSKTRATLQDEMGNTLGKGEGGPGNIKTSVMGSWQSVRSAINNALSNANIPDIERYQIHVGLGMAGSTEVPASRASFLNVPHPYHTLILDSDASAACIGAHGSSDGAIILVGTGVMGFQIENAIESRVGGYGFPHSDEGGGAWLGMELSRATFQAFDGRQPWTPLLRTVFDRFQQDIFQFSTFANQAKPGDFAELAPLLIEALNENDPFAVCQIKMAAHEIDRLWDALKAKATRILPCCLLGGIAPFLEPYLSHRLRANIVLRKFDATIGAIMLLKQHMGIPV